MTDNGLKEARAAGNILKNRGFVFDVALVKYLDDLPDDGVISLNIPTGTPLVCELDNKHKPIRHYYLTVDGEVPVIT